MEQRIQKILSNTGIASRRKAEELIMEGRVTVNGMTAALGMKADPLRDHIKLDGRLVAGPESRQVRPVYLLLNKPRGVVTTLRDPEGRPTVKDLLKGIRQKVFPVGRLDFHSEGLLLLTNDGDFGQALLHPSKGIPKTYLVKVKDIIGDEEIGKLRRGVRLEDGMTLPARVRKVSTTGNNSWVEITITEGRNRQVRRMFEAVGHPVLKLKRIALNGLRLGDLKPGEIRPLTAEELKAIRREAGMAGPAGSRKPAVAGKPGH